MKNKTKKQFTAGTIREQGDEVRRTDIPDEQMEVFIREGIRNKTLDLRLQKPYSLFYGYGWEKTDLVGWPILESDLMHLEFRRQ